MNPAFFTCSSGTPLRKSIAVGTFAAQPSPSSISSARLIATPAFAPYAMATATNKTSREASPAT